MIKAIMGWHLLIVTFNWQLNSKETVMDILENFFFVMLKFLPPTVNTNNYFLFGTFLVHIAPCHSANIE